MKKFLLGASSAALVLSAQGVLAQASTEADAPSILQRVLEDVNSAVGQPETTFGDGNISSVLSNIAATQTTVITDIETTTAGPVTTSIDQVFGNIDASVTAVFEKTNDNLLSSSISFAPDGVTQIATTDTFQKMEGTLGNVATLTLGASLDASAAIEGGANQALNESQALGAGAGGDAAALAQTTAQEAVVATNLALNTVDLDSAVSITATDFNLTAAGVDTTAIGAVGGGSIINGKIDQLNSAIFGVVGN